MKPAVALIVAALLLASPSFGAARKAPPPRPTPQAGATAFYSAYIKLPPGGIPNARARARLRPLVTDALYALLQNGDRAEERHAEQTRREEPPLLEGDIFTSLFEGANAFSVGDCTSTGEMTATCSVNLTYITAGQADTHWTDTVMLVRQERRFRVDDIVYGGTWPFANRGRMSKTLMSAIAQAEMPQN